MKFFNILERIRPRRMATNHIVAGAGKMAPENVNSSDVLVLPKKCSVKGCATVAEHPDSGNYLFRVDGRIVDKCRWCRRQEEELGRPKIKPQVLVAIDMKIQGVKEPKEYQLSREYRRLIRRKENYLNTLIYVSDGERIWALKDFRTNVKYGDMDWEMFNHLYPEAQDWHLIETV